MIWHYITENKLASNQYQLCTKDTCKGSTHLSLSGLQRIEMQAILSSSLRPTHFEFFQNGDLSMDTNISLPPFVSDLRIWKVFFWNPKMAIVVEKSRNRCHLKVYQKKREEKQIHITSFKFQVNEASACCPWCFISVARMPQVTKHCPKKNPHSRLVGGQVFRYQTCNHSLSNEVVVYLIEVLSPKRLVGFGNRHGIGIPCGTCTLEACTMYVYMLYIYRYVCLQKAKCTGASDYV